MLLLIEKRIVCFLKALIYKIVVDQQVEFIALPVELDTLYSKLQSPLLFF